MGRPKKSGKFLNIKLSDNVYDTLCRYSDDTGQSKTLAVEWILTKAFNDYYSMPEGQRVPIKGICK